MTETCYTKKQVLDAVYDEAEHIEKTGELKTATIGDVVGKALRRLEGQRIHWRFEEEANQTHFQKLKK